jgi:hypothetical protein
VHFPFSSFFLTSPPFLTPLPCSPLLNLQAAMGNASPAPSSYSMAASAAGGFGVKRRWDDDVIFKNQSSVEENKGPEFINDLLRTARSTSSAATQRSELTPRLFTGLPQELHEEIRRIRSLSYPFPSPPSPPAIHRLSTQPRPFLLVSAKIECGGLRRNDTYFFSFPFCCASLSTLLLRLLRQQLRTLPGKCSKTGKGRNRTQEEREDFCELNDLMMLRCL